MSALEQRVRNASPARLLAGMSIGIAALITPVLVSAPKLVLWNATASVPIGLYFVHPGISLRPNDLAVSELPEHAQRLARSRGYLPDHVLLIKPVAAVTGEEVCRDGAQVSVNGRPLAIAKSADRRQRPLPNWQGCRTLSPTELFLMNPRVADSFDGRYFGPTDRRLVHGRAFPLLTVATHVAR